MIFKHCDVCGNMILNINGGLCSHCYYQNKTISYCTDCGAELKPSDYFNQDGKCFSCYAIKELYECDTCGREISYSDYMYYNGECEACYSISD